MLELAYGANFEGLPSAVGDCASVACRAWDGDGDGSGMGLGLAASGDSAGSALDVCGGVRAPDASGAVGMPKSIVSVLTPCVGYVGTGEVIEGSASEPLGWPRACARLRTLGLDGVGVLEMGRFCLLLASGEDGDCGSGLEKA
jgi:hypothetical protein